MKKYITKYSLILIVLIGFLGLVKFIAISQLSIILVKSGMELNEANFTTNSILISIPYLINIIIAIFVLIDLSKLKIKSIPVILVTVFSYYAGIILFLFLINHKIERNEK